MAHKIKIAILANYSITSDVLLKPKPNAVILPTEPHYEKPIDDPTEVNERERNSKNS